MKYNTFTFLTFLILALLAFSWTKFRGGFFFLDGPRPPLFLNLSIPLFDNGTDLG